MTTGKRMQCIPVFQIDACTFLLFSAFYIGDMLDVYVLALLAALLHECGHLLGILLCGGKLQGLYLKPFGVHIQTKNNDYFSYYKDIFVYALGPLCNGVAAVITYCVMMHWGGGLEAAYFCGTNLVLLIINLIPAKMLDGGKIVSSILLLHCDYTKTLKMMHIVSIICAVFVMIAGIAVLYVTKYNISLLAIGLFIGAVLIDEGRGEEKEVERSYVLG